MTNTDLVKQFYESFSRADAEGMIACYHPEIIFQDPAFGQLKGDDAKNMWRMLIERSKGEIKIAYQGIKADEQRGEVQWRAEYVFVQTGRKVINNISAKFEFKDGKIIRHTDYFDMWKWTKQALGWKGYLLGWSSFMQNQIQKQTSALLKSYSEKNKR